MRPPRSDCCASLPASGSTPMTLQAGASCGGRERAAADQPAAADAHEQVVERADLLEQFLGHRALAGDDVRVVEGRDQRAAALGEQAPRDGLAILASCGRRDDLGAVAAGRRELVAGASAA